MFKTYVGLVRDHTGSMCTLVKPAMADYNATIQAFINSDDTNNDIIVSVVKCGHGREGIAYPEIVNASCKQLKPLASYPAQANSTPLYDSVGMLIEMFKALPDANDPNVSFLIITTTDGGENSSRKWTGSSISKEIQNLQKTDRWTFAFRVPRGNARQLTQYGIPAENIIEWEQTTRGMETAQAVNTSAVTSFMQSRSAGTTSTTRFYANLQDVSITEVKQQLIDISASVQFFPIASHEVGTQIRTFVESKINGPMLKGAAFYKLVKLEPKVQAHKRLVIRHKQTGAVYSGDAARYMLALPNAGTFRLAPDELGEFEVFIQSTSVNRKVDANSEIMYWPQVGTEYQASPSAR